MKNGEIHFKKLKDLPIFAASGLAKHQENFYLIADDEKSLYQFNLNNNTFTETPLQVGVLPTDHKERKRLKPDWEALAYFANERGLLVVPSGSKPNRQIGYFIHLHERSPKTKAVDFSNLYQNLQKNFDELNIEGATVSGSTVQLLQRGNGKSNQNALIDLDLKRLLQDIQASSPLSSENILNIQFFELGKLNHSPLSFTDAFAIDGNIYFLAVCEETISTYEDGPFKGAILGQINSERKISATWNLDCPFKPEGLWMEKSEGHYKVYLVTDADSREQVSSLYVGELKW